MNPEDCSSYEEIIEFVAKLILLSPHSARIELILEGMDADDRQTLVLEILHTVQRLAGIKRGVDPRMN